MLADLGYLGTAAITGTRKPRGGELGEVRRACNRAINSTRAAVERAIATWSTGRSSTPAGADASPTSPKSYAPSPDWRSTEPGDNHILNNARVLRSVMGSGESASARADVRAFGG